MVGTAPAGTSSRPPRGPGNAWGGHSVGKAMEVLAFPSRLRAPRSADHHSATVTAAKVMAVAGLAAYNWWVVVPFVPGLMPSVNGFFSDLEATGMPHAALMSDADLAAGVLMVAALLLRGPRAGQRSPAGVEVDGGVRVGRRGGRPVPLRLRRGSERHLPPPGMAPAAPRPPLRPRSIRHRRVRRADHGRGHRHASDPRPVHHRGQGVRRRW